jgi:hypothetical protein
MTKFSEKHLGNSPVKQLGKNRADRLIKRAQKRSERGGETGGYNYSDKKVVKLLDKAKKLKNKKSSKSYGEDTRVSMSFERPDMDTSPLNQGGYVGGGMSASDYAPVGDLYMNMFNSISSAAREYDENKNDPEVQARSKAMKAQRLGKRIDKIDSKLPKNTGETYTYINDEGKEVEEFFVDPTLNAKQIGKRNKLQGKRADALVDQTQFEDIAKQSKQNDYNSLIANMTEADKKKYGIIT